MFHLDVRTSGIWQTNSTVLSSGGEVVIVDPAFFPRELTELAELAEARGRSARVVFTHGHWDHVAGWRTFPGAPVLGSARLARAVAESDESARHNLAALADFDGRWYVPRAEPPAWPPAVEPLADGDTFAIGDVSIEALHLPGHSDDGLGLLLPREGLLLVGDYLSPCEIPFVEDLTAYRATLRRLAELIDRVAAVIPGHGPRLDRAAATTIVRADLDYLDALAAAGEGEGCLSITLPRAADVPGMAARHRENCVAAGLSPAR